MRATSDSPAMFLAPQPPETERDTDRDEDMVEMTSEFAVALGLLSSPAIIPPQRAPDAPAAPSAGDLQAVEAAPKPAAPGIDIAMFDLTPRDEPVALPLEAALQQLSATIDPSTMAPEVAPAPASAPASAPAPARVIATPHEVVEVVTRHVARGEQQITMVLKPAELGEVKVRVEHVRGDQVKITLEAEKPESTQLLRERVPELQAALQQQGVTVRSVDVSLQASDGMSHRGTGGDAPAHHQRADRDEPTPSEEATRTSKRTKRNKKDLDVLV